MKKIIIIITAIIATAIWFLVIKENIASKSLTPNVITNQKLLLKVRFDTQVSNSLMVCPYQNNADLPTVTPYKSLLVNDTDTLLNLTKATNEGDNALIDWVLVSLRDSASTIQTRSGIVQADGDIVALDGISPLTFTVSGNYFISIKHRNHLAFRTENEVNITSDIKYFDFTNNSVEVHGSNLLMASNGYFVMVGGDANADGSINGVGDLSIWESQNGLWEGYGLKADFNLDGSVDAEDAVYFELYNGLHEEL